MNEREHHLRRPRDPLRALRDVDPGRGREVEGVEDVAVDLEAKVVTVSGRELDDAALRAAIEEAGYDAE